MSSDAWFREFEKLEAQREDGEITGTDEELADKANAALVDRRADQIDRARDRRKEG